ncbi:uncharacterized protein Dmoj_GI17672 [Drosophila mojavensis]|uniref:glycerol-3-phosphate dehydrogenase n=1 Tax=Drosophila mojavensis TaxID=7230 RepID=B4KIR4_DROMO|nr:uncharacterized protein Dmoj_GI17672 [Drosophila mojavensis]
MLMKMRMSLAASAWPKQPYRLLSSMSAMLHQGLKAGKESSGQMPKRKQQMTSLRSEHFDILVIGGGAIGCGCALEAASRGLKTALIEAEDFASGASCKSSKLIEGSNSYLHAAIQGADLQQIFMLQQLLNERATMLTIAPHLNRVQPMLMPIYSPLRLPLYWLGLKMYDAMAGMTNVRGSHFLSKQATLNEFPLLRKDGLLGSLIYYDVQLDDARMCLALAMTAVKHGATVANYVRLLKLMPSCYQDCREVLVDDALQEESFIINTRVIINATGAGTDAIRKLEDCRANPIAVPHWGTHIALPGYYGSQNCGLLFPSCDGGDEALIMLPFENRLLVGSMDVEHPEQTGEPPAPTADVVNCLLGHTRRVLDDCVQLREEHVLSAWTGVKPSIMCPTNADTATDQDMAKDQDQDQDRHQDKEPQVVPNFLLEVSGNQMITLAGGRWSTYRVMAVDAINTAIESKNNNTRYASTASTAESSTPATVPSSDSEVTIIMPSRSVSRLNAVNDQISERLIVGNALEVGSRIHDTVTILRQATASLKKIKENMRKSKSIDQLPTDATSASNASSIGIAQDVSESPELQQPKQADDDKRRSGITNTKQNDNDLGTKK